MRVVQSPHCKWATAHTLRVAKQDAASVPQKHTESTISIPSLGLFDTNNPDYDLAEEKFRKRMEKNKKRRGPKL